MARRDDPDPLLLQTVSRRLARLLAEAGGREEDEEEDEGTESGGAARPARATAPVAARAAGGGATGHGAGPDPARTDGSGISSSSVAVDEVPAPRRFGRRHVAVVCLLLVLGLGWAGWTLLRARPVAIAAPVVVSAAASPALASPGGPGSAGPPGSAGSAASAGGAAPPGPTSATPGAASASPTAAVVVHVLGAVRRPGLVELPAPARVQDAVDAAGGFRRDADPGNLNLAQLLVDGQQVVIGTHGDPDGEVRGGSVGGGSAGGTGSSGDGSGTSGGGAGGEGAAGGGGAPAVVDLNTATEAELEDLPGVGPVTAAAILAWRQEHGRFSRAEELQEVDGIGPKTFARLAPHVRV